MALSVPVASAVIDISQAPGMDVGQESGKVKSTSLFH